jgi:hypothetical protein
MLEMRRTIVGLSAATLAVVCATGSPAATQMQPNGRRALEASFVS